MRFVDANVFIYILVKSPKEDYLTSKSILKRIEDGEEAITSTSIIQEVVEWLEYNNRHKEVKKFLIALNSYVAMRKVETSWREMLDAASDMEKYDLDFVDALTLQVMKRNNVTEIYTNDRDFDRVEWVRRIWK
ncbi:MAG: type II toxin-antitoxin system VapC family toxin [Candidatus Methanomethylicia archaeon]